MRGATLAAALFAGLLLGKHSGEVPVILEETEPVSQTSAGAGETLLKEQQRLLLAERDFAMEMLFLRWARTDPEGAIVTADREHDPSLWLKGIYRAWGAYELMAALESLEARKEAVQIGSIAWHLRDYVTSESVDEVFEFMRDRRWRYLWNAVWKEMNDLDEVKALGYLLESMLPADVEGAEVLARQSQHPDGLVQFAKMCAHRDLEAAVKWG